MSSDKARELLAAACQDEGLVQNAQNVWDADLSELPMASHKTRVPIICAIRAIEAALSQPAPVRTSPPSSSEVG